MQLLTPELRKSLPALYSEESVKDPQVICKFLTPDSNWTWFVTEGSPDEDNDQDIRFFGYVISFEEEWGYFMLSELESAPSPPRLPIELDLHFQPGVGNLQQRQRVNVDHQRGRAPAFLDRKAPQALQGLVQFHAAGSLD